MRREAVAFADCSETPLLPGDDIDPLSWTAAIFGAAPDPVLGLMRLRDALVRPFGLHPAGRTRGVFPLVALEAQRAVMGMDDRHLDFRVVTTIDPQADMVRLTTVVRIHSALGRMYWLVVRPFHRRIVPAMLRRAAHPVVAADVRPQSSSHPAGADEPRPAAEGVG